MPFFEWKKEYCTGVESIDEQHQRLVSMVNRLHENMDAKEDMRLMLEVFLDQLISYTDYHFKNEEQLMSDYHYADEKAHLAMHNKLRSDVVSFRNDFLAGKADISASLMTFLKNWLQDHILGTDHKLAAALPAEAKASLFS